MLRLVARAADGAAAAEAEEDMENVNAATSLERFDHDVAKRRQWTKITSNNDLLLVVVAMLPTVTPTVRLVVKGRDSATSKKKRRRSELRRSHHCRNGYSADK